LLKQYFNSTDIAPELARFAPLFQVLVAEQKVASTSPNPTVLATVPTKRKTFSFNQYAAAASIALLVCVGLAYLNLPKEQTQQLAANDIKPERLAAQETTPELVTNLQQQIDNTLVLPPDTEKNDNPKSQQKVEFDIENNNARHGTHGRRTRSGLCASRNPQSFRANCSHI
jgi:negative regulator of sigma E activity